jgi:hypothetical protein
MAFVGTAMTIFIGSGVATAIVVLKMIMALTATAATAAAEWRLI